MKSEKPGKRATADRRGAGGRASERGGAGDGNGGAGGDPAPNAHTIVSPQPSAIGEPLPTARVFVVNGVGYIEAAGTSMCMVGIATAFGKVFRNATLAPNDPSSILGDCIMASVDPMGMYYRFLGSLGNMVSDAQGGNSIANYLVTWAMFKGTSVWVRCNNGAVQFMGVDY